MADPLSRKKASMMELQGLITTLWVDWKILEEEIANDTLLRQIKADLLSYNRDHKGFSVENDRDSSRAS